MGGVGRLGILTRLLPSQQVEFPYETLVVLLQLLYSCSHILQPIDVFRIGSTDLVTTLLNFYVRLVRFNTHAADNDAQRVVHRLHVPSARSFSAESNTVCMAAASIGRPFRDQ